MMQQEVDVRRFEEGSTFRRGSGPTDAQRATKEKRAQMEQGRSFAQLLQNQAAIEMQREGKKILNTSSLVGKQDINQGRRLQVFKERLYQGKVKEEERELVEKTK